MQHKKVEFQKIRVQNFLSYGETPIEIEFKNGITFVTGYNKDEDDTNGVGKTSLIVESLSFLIFGETYRNINLKLVKNNITTGPCIVEGWLKVNNDEYHITRSLSPNKLFLDINGQGHDKFTKTIPETTKDIIDAIGISKTLFTNTIVMTNKDSFAFLNQKKDLKIKFIEGILGLEAFAEFFKKAKDEFKAMEDEKGKALFCLSELEKGLMNDEKSSIDLEADHQSTIDKLEKSIKELENAQPTDNTAEITKLEDEILTISSPIAEKEAKIKRAKEKKFEIEYIIKQKTSDLKTLNSKDAVCPSCKRPFEGHDQNELVNEISKTTNELSENQTIVSKLKNAIDNAQREVDTITNKVRQIRNNIAALQHEQQSFIQSTKQLDKIRTELEVTRNFKNPFTPKIVAAKERIENQKLIVAKYQKDSRLANIIKEMAAPTGVKSLMVKKIIKTFNDSINHYLHRLGSPFKMTFDEYFEESISHKNGKIYSYDSLSGGEAKRVDFSMLFAFRDIRRMQSNVSVNITVMDELFDSALSEKGMFNIIELLKENADESYFIVTHRPTSVDITGCDMIYLVKENGITTIQNYE